MGIVLMNKMSLNEQAQEILRIAEQHGVEQNFFFLTTFKRYQVQLQILGDLEKTIKEDGILVTKEYVKGRKNVYSHPAISDYNRTTDSAKPINMNGFGYNLYVRVWHYSFPIRLIYKKFRHLVGRVLRKIGLKK